MRPSGLVVASSLLGIAAVGLIVTGWRPPRASLERTVRHLFRPGAASGTSPRSRGDAPTGAGAWTARIGSSIVGREPPAIIARCRRPLRLCGLTLEAHVGRLVLAALAGFLAPSVLLFSGRAAGIIEPGLFVPLGLSLAAALLVPLAAHSATMTRAAEVGIDLRHQLSAFLDMVTMLLAGNTGHEGALDQAARAGDGMLFRELRRRMREVSAYGHSLTGALALVADDLGLDELEQVAAATALAAAEGAPVARTLAAKCSTLRSTLAADHEAAARVRTDKVTPPLVGMALLFMALIVYPALAL